MCHWERTLAMPGDTFSLGLLSSIRLYQSARTYQAVLGLAARMALEGWDRPPDLLPLAAVCSHQTSHSAGDLKEDETSEAYLEASASVSRGRTRT